MSNRDSNPEVVSPNGVGVRYPARPDSVVRVAEATRHMEAAVTSWKAAMRVFNGSVDYDLGRVLAYVDALFERFAPFRAGDIVEIVTSRHEDTNIGPGSGWYGHDVSRGRRGTVRSVDFSHGKFNAMVELHDQTWTDDHGQKHPIERPGQYCLWENDIIKVVGPMESAANP